MYQLQKILIIQNFRNVKTQSPLQLNLSFHKKMTEVDHGL